MPTILLSNGRTGSELICYSLLRAGLKVKSEVLNPKHPDCLDRDILNKDEQEKIKVVDSTLVDNILCKVLYYQVKPETVEDLAKRYQLVRLTREPFDVFISYKIALRKNPWHKFPPVDIPASEMTGFVNSYLKQEEIYSKICPISYSYEYVTGAWDTFITNFQLLLGLNPINVPQKLVKNNDIPEQYISNFQELKAEYESLYN